MKIYTAPSQLRLLPFSGECACTPICICFAAIMLKMRYWVRDIFSLDDTDTYLNHYLEELKTTKEIQTRAIDYRAFCRDVMIAAIHQGTSQYLYCKSIIDYQKLIRRLQLIQTFDSQTISLPGIPLNFAAIIKTQIELYIYKKQFAPVALFITAGEHTVVLINFEHHIFFFDPKISSFSFTSNLRIYKKSHEIPILERNICTRFGTISNGAAFYKYKKQ